jgi:hypothetical protein
MMLKKLCLSAASFASPAFISHQIINPTSSDINFILRQISIYQYQDEWKKFLPIVKLPAQDHLIMLTRISFLVF